MAVALAAAFSFVYIMGFVEKLVGLDGTHVHVHACDNQWHSSRLVLALLGLQTVSFKKASTQWMSWFNCCLWCPRFNKCFLSLWADFKHSFPLKKNLAEANCLATCTVYKGSRLCNDVGGNYCRSGNFHCERIFGDHLKWRKLNWRNIFFDV